VRCAAGATAMLLASALSPAPSVSAQSVVTVVGGGNDDGGPATAAALLEALAAVADGAGNILIADGQGNRIRRVSAATGLITTVAGTGARGFKGDGLPATLAQIAGPSDLERDTAGNLYFAESDRLRRVDARTGVISTVAAGFLSLFGIGLDPSGAALYAVDPVQNHVSRVDIETGALVNVAGVGGNAGHSGDGGPATAAGIPFPTDVAVDSAGDLYISSYSGHRVRRVDARTGIISTLAGSGEPGSSGDGGPATLAKLNSPTGLALDGRGGLLIAEQGRVRRVDLSSASIATVAGGGSRPPSEGGPATSVLLASPWNVSADGAGTLLIAERQVGRILRVDAATGLLTTVAGSVAGGLLRDGQPAAQVGLVPTGICIDDAGDLTIADFRGRLRKWNRATDIVTTVAGGGAIISAEGLPATSASLDTVNDVARDGAGNLYFGEPFGHDFRRVDAATGTLKTVAGNGTGAFSGDGGPATAAAVQDPQGVAVDATGTSLYLSTATNTRFSGRVRKVDLRTGLISTVGGNGTSAFTGDGGPATAAGLGAVAGLALDREGNIYVADRDVARVRRIEAASGLIATVAGGGSGGDGVPATQAQLGSVTDMAFDAAGNMYIADRSRIWKVDAASGIIQSLVGDGTFVESSGDGGPRTKARLSDADAVAVDGQGALFFTDARSRVRAVFPCKQSLGAFDASSPADGAVSGASSVNVSWSKAASAFTYDLLVDSEFPPRKVAQGDIAGSALQLSGLTPGKTYFWRVRAKGDIHCPAVERLSGVRRFTIPIPCVPPEPPQLLAPASPGPTTTLAAAAPSGAASYDVYLGSGRVLPLVAARLATPSHSATGLVPGTAYRWRVIAHAACDQELASSSAEGTFTVPGGCADPAPPALSSPAAGSADVPPAVTLAWIPSGEASTYDVYLGESADPPLFASAVSGAMLPVTLKAGVAYRWKVVARAACEAARSSASAVRSFTTSPCPAPAAPASLTSTKGAAFLGSSYALSWSPVEGLAAGSVYRVERSKSADFAGAETLLTAGTSAVLTADEMATYRHRVSAVPSCGAAGPASAPLNVAVTAAPPFLTITSPPPAMVIAQPAEGIPLPRAEVEIRNTGTSDFVGFVVTSQPIPFFTVSESVTSLRAGQARILYAQFTGIPKDQAGRYEGLLSLVSADPASGVAYPQVALSLRITDGRAGAAVPESSPPLFLVDGRPVESVRFETAAVGAAPEPLTIDLKNPGSAPLDLAADIAPDPWVSVEAADGTLWNASPIAPGAVRAIRLVAQRSRGDSGGAFPRTTYVTFRTGDGRSSRLAVEDTGPPNGGPCPGRAALRPGETSLIVPSVVNAVGRGGVRFVSRLLVTNLGADPAQADLYFTSDSGEPGTNGYDCAQVRFASVVVPPGDVLAWSDPVGQLFGLDQSSGQVEVRSSRIGQLRVQSVVDAPAPDGGSFGFQLPTVTSREGARQGAPQVVIGVLQDAIYRSNLILAETSGERATVTVTLYDEKGRSLGSAQRDLPPYSKKQLAVSELAPPGAVLTAGALEIAAEPGSAGSVVGVITVIDGRTGDASSFASRPLAAVSRASRSAIASVVVSGTFKSRVEIRNNDSRPVTYTLDYRGSTGARVSAARTLAPKAEDAWNDVLTEVFGLQPTSFGPLFVDADSPHLSIVSRVYSETSAGSYGDAIEGLALDDATTTGESGRTVLVDGLEGTAGGDRSRGARTNLILTEVGGGTAELEVTAWEKTQRRTAPVGRLTVSLGPNQQRQINDIFGPGGFGIGVKDRLNVLCEVRPKPGSTGRVIALATRIDNRTNDTKNLPLRP